MQGGSKCVSVCVSVSLSVCLFVTTTKWKYFWPGQWISTKPGGGGGPGGKPSVPHLVLTRANCLNRWVRAVLINLTIVAFMASLTTRKPTSRPPTLKNYPRESLSLIITMTDSPTRTTVGHDRQRHSEELRCFVKSYRIVQKFRGVSHVVNHRRRW